MSHYKKLLPNGKKIIAMSSLAVTFVLFQNFGFLNFPEVTPATAPQKPPQRPMRPERPKIPNSTKTRFIDVFSNPNAFAALRANGSVVVWGNKSGGGDSSAVRSQLTSGVVHVYSNEGSFAALKSNGSVVTWGDQYNERSPFKFKVTSASIASKLNSGVVKIFATKLYAYAALKENGSVVTWGNEHDGGDSSSVASKLNSRVVYIYSTDRAFAALKDDGSVVTWGDRAEGGNPSTLVEAKLAKGVVYIASTDTAFAAIKDDGSVVTWGHQKNGGDSSDVSNELSSNVVRLYSNRTAFAALKSDGSVVTWGALASGGNGSTVEDNTFGSIKEVSKKSALSSGVVRVFANEYAFAALKDNGSVIAWGNTMSGGNNRYTDYLKSELSSGVVNMIGDGEYFAALKSNGSIVIWGDDGGSNQILDFRYPFVLGVAIKKELASGVIQALLGDFSFLKSDGSVLSREIGVKEVQSKINSGVTKIFSNDFAVVALKSNGTLVNWGDIEYGGNIQYGCFPDSGGYVGTCTNNSYILFKD